MISKRQAAAESYVVLYGIPWKVYEGILDALGEYHLRHTYDCGALEMPSLLHSVSWSDYMRFLDALGDRSLRHTYDGGELEIMSPRKDHDWIKSFIGRMIEYIAVSFEIDIQCIGSTTLTGERVTKGFQPDEAYYVANEAVVRGKKTYVRTRPAAGLIGRSGCHKQLPGSHAGICSAEDQ